MMHLKQIWGFTFGLIDKTNSWLGFVGGILLFMLTIITAFEVFMRYFLNSPTFWAFEVSELVLMVMVMFTLGYVLKVGRHVSMRAAVDILPDKLQHLIDGIVSIISAIICGLISYQGLLMALSSLQTHQRLQDTNIQLWPVKMTVFIGFLLFALQFLYRGVHCFSSLANKERKG